jgi:hypothetical protein
MNLNPKIWGPHAWFFLDSVIMSINNDDMNVYKDFFVRLGDVLPCGSCRVHYNDYLASFPLNDIRTKDELFIWFNNLHNRVRTKSGKKPRDIKTVTSFYNDEYNNSNLAAYCIIVAALCAFIFIFVRKWKN